MLIISSVSIYLAAAIGNPQDSIAKLQIRGREYVLELAGSAFHRTRAKVSDLRTLPIGDHAATITWREGTREFAALSSDRKTIGRVIEPSYILPLRYAQFDPLVSLPSVAKEYQSPNSRLRIVQFFGQPLPEHAEAITEAGGTVCRFLPETAYVCDGDKNAYALIAKIPGVRWIGEYQPAYRTFPELLNTALPFQKYVVELKDSAMSSKVRAADSIWLMGGMVDNANAGSNLIEASLTNEQFLSVLALDEVFFAAPAGEPGEDMDKARTTSNVVYIDNNLGFRGQGVRGEVMDGNLLTTHQDFTSNGRSIMVHTAGSGSQTHGTSTTGIVFGDGTANATGKGVLSLGKAIFAGYSNYGGGSRYAHTQQLVSSPYFAVFQSNSWGNSQVTQYNSFSQEMDRIIFELGLLILNSQSNTGNNTSRPEAWAKNVLSIGGVFHNNTDSRTDDSWSSASYGPAEDGRIKPDLAHFYDNIFCPTSGTITSYTSSFGGTSGATPIAAGLSGILFQMWSEGVFGQSVLTARTPADRFVFDARCKFTTAKALLINQAYQYDMATTNLSRVRQGWGMPDLKPLYDKRLNMLIVNETDVLTNLQTKSYKIYVPSGTPDLRCTMSYSDLAGTTSSLQHRINDLSLKVTGPGAVTYFGNNGLSAARWSTIGGAFDTKNTVENVFVLNPTSGVWTIEVSAPAIVQDGRIETPSVMDADYALVVTGCTPVAVPTNMSIVGGGALSGAIANLESSNEQRVSAQWTADPARDDLFDYAFVFTGTCPIPVTLSSMRFRIEELNSVAGKSFSIELFNFVSGSWESTMSGNTSTTEQVREVVISNDPARFVQAGTREVRARIRCYGDPGILTSVTTTVDQARWFFDPQ